MSILEEINTQAENNPLTKEELKKYGWKSNKERNDALKKIARDMGKYIMNTSPAFKLK